MIGAKPDIDAPEVGQRSDQESRPNQQHECRRDLRDDECVAREHASADSCPSRML